MRERQSEEGRRESGGEGERERTLATRNVSPIWCSYQHRKSPACDARLQIIFPHRMWCVLSDVSQIPLPLSLSLRSILDVLIVAVSWVAILDPEIPALNLIRFIRVFRVLKLFHWNQSLRQIIVGGPCQKLSRERDREGESARARARASERVSEICVCEREILICCPCFPLPSSFSPSHPLCLYPSVSSAHRLDHTSAQQPHNFRPHHQHVRGAGNQPLWSGPFSVLGFEFRVKNRMECRM